jgi:hypothetical protein
MTATDSPTSVSQLADAALWRSLAECVEGLQKWVWDDPRVTDELTRAEGFRYLTRLIAGGIPLAMEAWDPLYPQLIRFLSPTLQYGLPAADCSYLWAAVHGDGVYRITGTRGSSRLFDVETRTGHTARIGAWKLVDRRSDFAVDSDGAIEIVLSRDEQPGNWIRLPEGPSSIIIREYYYDWLTEAPAFLNLHRDGVTYPAPPLTPERVIEGAEILRDWLTQLPAACAAAVNTHYDAPADGLVFGALDFGWKDLQYGKGTYRCASDEAVIIEFEPPDADYWNVQLCSHFWEARDYHLRQSSINGLQAAVEGDGVFRAVIAHRDPGTANWLDPAGNESGLIAARYFRAADGFDAPRMRMVAFADLGRELPPSTVRITPEERSELLRARAWSFRRRNCG